MTPPSLVNATVPGIADARDTDQGSLDVRRSHIEQAAAALLGHDERRPLSAVWHRAAFRRHITHSLGGTCGKQGSETTFSEAAESTVIQRDVPSSSMDPLLSQHAQLASLRNNVSGAAACPSNFIDSPIPRRQDVSWEVESRVEASCEGPWLCCGVVRPSMVLVPHKTEVCGVVEKETSPRRRIVVGLGMTSECDEKVLSEYVRLGSLGKSTGSSLTRFLAGPGSFPPSRARPGLPGAFREARSLTSDSASRVWARCALGFPHCNRRGPAPRSLRKVSPPRVEHQTF